jgi:hypothetical protein
MGECKFYLCFPSIGVNRFMLLKESAAIMVSASRLHLPTDEVEKILDEELCECENIFILMSTLV